MRSVNGRFLDLSLRLPDELRGLEPALREVAVVTPGSQSPYPRADWAALLDGRRLLLLFHQDEAGRQGARCRGQGLISITHGPSA